MARVLCKHLKSRIRSSAIPCAPSVHGPVQKITLNETIMALKKMKSGKATGPDDLAAELWKSKGWNLAGWLTEFFNLVVAEKKVPESWQEHDYSYLEEEGQSRGLHLLPSDSLALAQHENL
uniref:Endonuclease-reverse transcriptase HmRTE-e01 n=1 Tax=Haemonchus contortus TaxID=6289 RepID=W6NGC3_HAECO